MILWVTEMALVGWPRAAGRQGVSCGVQCAPWLGLVITLGGHTAESAVHIAAALK